MNKNYLFVGIGAVSIAIVIVVAVVLFGTATSMSLDQILASKDCQALDKWGDDHLYDENLNLTDEQQNKIMSVGFGCGMKAVKNMFGGADSSSTVTDEHREALRVFTDIRETQDCDRMAEWNDAYGNLPNFMSNKEKISKIRFDSFCGF